MKCLLFIFLGLMSCGLAAAQSAAVIEGIIDEQEEPDGRWAYLSGYEHGGDFFIRDSCLVSEGRFVLRYTPPYENCYDLLLPVSRGYLRRRIYVAPGDRQRLRVGRDGIVYDAGTKNENVYSMRDSIERTLAKWIDSLECLQTRYEYGTAAHKRLGDSIRAIRNYYFTDLPMRYLNEPPFCACEALGFDALNMLVDHVSANRFDSVLLVLQQRFPHNRQFSEYKVPHHTLAPEMKKDYERFWRLFTMKRKE